MFGNLDPKKVEKVQQVTQNITAEIRADYAEESITIKLRPMTPEAKQFVEVNLMSQFPQMLATQLSTFFSIKGELVHVNKPK